MIRSAVFSAAVVCLTLALVFAALRLFLLSPPLGEWCVIFAVSGLFLLGVAFVVDS